MVGERSEIEYGNESFEFDCPSCGAHIKGNVTSCPNCNVEFLIEEVVESVCSKCGESFPIEKGACPFCGSRSTLNVLPETIGSPNSETHEIKSAIEDPKGQSTGARFQVVVDEMTPSTIIGESIDPNAKAGSALDHNGLESDQNDIDQAELKVTVRLPTIVSAMKERIIDDLELLETLIAEARQDINDTEDMDGSSIPDERIVDSDAISTPEGSRDGSNAVEISTERSSEASYILVSLEDLVHNSERFNINVRSARKLLEDAKDAAEKEDWETMNVLSEISKESIIRLLPDLFEKEINKGKIILTNLNATDKDISILAKMLKDVEEATNGENYQMALERMILFKDEMKRWEEPGKNSALLNII